MPVVEQEAHIQSAKDKDLRLDCKVAFQDQAFLEEYHQHVKDARLLHRLQMGRTWANALDQADRGQGLAKQLAQDIDKDTSYIYQHTRAWNAVKDSFQPQPQKEGFPWDKFERPSGKMALQREVESELWAYIYDCEDEGRNKSLSALNRWVSEDKYSSGQRWTSASVALRISSVSWTVKCRPSKTLLVRDRCQSAYKKPLRASQSPRKRKWGIRWNGWPGSLTRLLSA